MKNGMNKEVMMLHELQTPPVSSNLRKQVNKKQKKSLSFTSQIFKKYINILYLLKLYLKKLFRRRFDSHHFTYILHVFIT